MTAARGREATRWLERHDFAHPIRLVRGRIADERRLVALGRDVDVDPGGLRRDLAARALGQFGYLAIDVDLTLRTRVYRDARRALGREQRHAGTGSTGHEHRGNGDHESLHGSFLV